MKKFVSNAKKGFTLLEVLLVVAIIAILAGIVIVALNPGKQLGDTRNSQRKADVNTILSAVYQYSIDNNGNLPASIPTIVAPADCSTTATNEVCKQGSASCTGFVDLSVVALNQKYLTAIPTDPSGTATSGSGYFIGKSANGRVTVCAPAREPSVLPTDPLFISVTK
jgi:type IV pilus assembly protein PilA